MPFKSIYHLDSTLLPLNNFTSNQIIKSKLFDFNIDQVKVSGLSEKNNLLILKDIQKFILGNIFSLKKEFFLEILKKNNLISSFEIKKIYPNTLEVKIEKTEFLGVTNVNGNYFFIGSNGKLINYNNLEKNLPYVFGKVNINKYIEFVKTVKKSNFKFNKIKEIYFFPSGRWDIKTKDDRLLKLPMENLISQLNSVEKVSKNEKFQSVKIIDLRFKNKIIITNE